MERSQLVLFFPRSSNSPNLSGMKVAMSGGVAHNQGVIRALSEALACPIDVPPEPDTVGALGAALIARERSA